MTPEIRGMRTTQFNADTLQLQHLLTFLNDSLRRGLSPESALTFESRYAEGFSELTVTVRGPLTPPSRPAKPPTPAPDEDDKDMYFR